MMKPENLRFGEVLNFVSEAAFGNFYAQYLYLKFHTVL